jgi:pullulanase
LVLLSQGVPFFHAGDDLLRSKSLDSNSYNSGDWFNRLDFTYESNNWAVGLPPNQQVSWPFMQPLLANPALKSGKADILSAAIHFQEMLRIRKSSLLFRLRTAEQIIQRVRFLNTGLQQFPNLLVMCIANPALDLDHEILMAAVLINASKKPKTFSDSSLNDLPFVLHPVQAASYDPVVRSARYDRVSGVFTLPARTTAVFLARVYGSGK